MIYGGPFRLERIVLPETIDLDIWWNAEYHQWSMGKPVFILFKSNSLWSKIFGLGIHHNRFKQSIIIIRVSTQVRIEGHILKSRWQFIIKIKESRWIMLIYLHKFRFMFSWFQDVHNGKTGAMIGNHGINNAWEYKLFRVLQFTVDLINLRTGGPRGQCNAWEQSVSGKEVDVFLEFGPFINLEKVYIKITCNNGVSIMFGNVWYDRL